MADFKIAFDITNANEGGYANNPSDHGGETYAGISRKFWPNWKGWQRIDEIKSQSDHSILAINHFASQDAVLKIYIQDFYKSNFWNPLKLDLVTDQQIANALYDFGVNSGVYQSAKTLQKALGLTQDGVIGNVTITALNTVTPQTISMHFNDERKRFYEQMANEAGQSQFLHSWLSRIVPYKV